MSWLVQETEDPSTGRPAWVVQCLEPHCGWLLHGVRRDMLPAAAFEHALTDHLRIDRAPEARESSVSQAGPPALRRGTGRD